ncbi:hypothetical protein OPQ81_001865 [Rhizoctonia solani]|nr:hypothetical protein OPQ81_001865 [Rhizoctonia solani]
MGAGRSELTPIDSCSHTELYTNRMSCGYVAENICRRHCGLDVRVPGPLVLADPGSIVRMRLRLAMSPQDESSKRTTWATEGSDMPPGSGLWVWTP